MIRVPYSIFSGAAKAGLSVSILELGEDAPSRIAAFMNRYASIGAQLADASLVYLAERENIDTVFTLDRRDFSVYRPIRSTKNWRGDG